MATLAGPAKYLVTNVEAKFGKIVVQFQGVKVLQPGFEEYVPHLKR